MRKVQQTTIPVPRVNKVTQSTPFSIFNICTTKPGRPEKEGQNDKKKITTYGQRGFKEALERERQAREEESQAREEERRGLEESARKAKAEVLRKWRREAEAESRRLRQALQDMLRKKEELEETVESLRQSWLRDGGDNPRSEGAGPP